jgi:hypothetical protein
MKPLSYFLTLLIGVGVLISALPASAQTISWGSAANDFLFDSNGAPLDASFTFEIGTFGTFVPDDTNMSLWLANWKVLDRVTAPAANGWDPSQGFFSSSFTLLSDGTSSRGPAIGSGFVFSPGEQAFIWSYNSQTMNIGTEWALLTNNSSDGNAADNWIIPPLPDPCNCTPGSASLDWRLSTASQPDFGGLNNEYGPGNVTGTPPTYSLQTAILPEPGSSLLVLTAGLLFTRRRRPSGK